jgi:uncharacterized repeat protein (TIGR04042 family)
MEFTLRWPDGAETRCYSPSLIIEDFLTSNTAYPLDDFLTRSRRALTEASNRVRVKYGFACSRAAATLGAIEDRATSLRDYADPQVLVLSFRRIP